MVGAQTIVVHGATDGIGREVALRLARKGRSVYASGSQRKALEELRRDAHGLPLQTIQLNPTDPESVARFKTRINRGTQNLGPDVLVNNSGCEMENDGTESTGLRSMCTQLERGLQGMVALIGAFAPQMRVRGWGRIVNICPTTGGVKALPPTVSRLCGDGAKAFSLAMGKELSPFGVDVVYVEPMQLRSRNGHAAVEEKTDGRTEAHDDPGTALELVDPGVLVRAVEMAIGAKNPPGLWPAVRGDRLLAAVCSALGDRWADQLVGLLGLVSTIRGRRPTPGKSS